MFIDIAQAIPMTRSLMKRAHELFKDDTMATGRHHFRQKGDVQTFLLAVRAVLMMWRDYCSYFYNFYYWLKMQNTFLNNVERRFNICFIFAWSLHGFTIFPCPRLTGLDRHLRGNRVPPPVQRTKKTHICQHEIQRRIQPTDSCKN